MEPQRFYKEVLLNALTTTIASTSILISEGCKNNESLVQYTNYYAAIALKSFHRFLFLNKDFNKKENAIKKYNLIYAEDFRDATQDPSDLEGYFKFLKVYTILDDDCQIIIYAILSLSKFYKTNSINKIKNILHTYIPKIKRLLKNADKYYKYFDFTIYTPLATKEILFNFLMETS